MPLELSISHLPAALVGVIQLFLLGGGFAHRLFLLLHLRVGQFQQLRLQQIQPRDQLLLAERIPFDRINPIRRGRGTEVGCL